jgi:hypothetical protein
MKRIVIIDTYPTTNIHEKTLIECIKSIKTSGLDIMIVSHKPISREIQEMVDYFIYDKENSLLPQNLTPYWWMVNDFFEVQIFDNGHSLTICKNIKTSLSLAKALGYDFFYFTESDNVFSQKDKEKLDELSDKVKKENKQMVFFKQNYNSDEHIYETLIFAGFIDFFIQNIKLPTTTEEFVEYGYKPTLELSFYDQLKELEENFLILENESKNYFNDSVINKFTQNSFKCEVIKTTQNSHILFIVNDARNTENIEFSINSDINKITLVPNSWYYLPIITKDVGDLFVEIKDGDCIINKHFNLNNLEKYNEKGILNFR